MTEISYLINRLDRMQEELISEIFLPKMQAHIVESLKSGPKTQHEIAKVLPDFVTNHLTCYAFYRAWDNFEKAGVILPISHGRGHPRTWQLSILKEKEA
jgi:hypothetical protein